MTETDQNLRRYCGELLDENARLRVQIAQLREMVMLAQVAAVATDVQHESQFGAAARSTRAAPPAAARGPA